jgi:hypothetical protein
MRTLVWNPDDPLALAEGESPKANLALNDYALMGAGRSLAGLIQKYAGRMPGSTSPTTNLIVLKRWSAADAWQDRVARYDVLLVERERAAYEARWAHRREAEREETWQLAQALRDKARKMLEFPLADVEQVTARRPGPGGVQHIDMTVIKPARWALRDIATMGETAAKLARLSADLPTERLAIEDLTPRDLEGMRTEELLLLRQRLERAKRHS